jgi:hypothetical protein
LLNGPAVPDPESPQLALQKEKIRYLINDIAKSFDTRAVRERLQKDEVILRWAKMSLRDGWTVEMLNIGWNNFLQDPDQRGYAPSYVDLTRYAYPSADSAQALIERLIRVKSAGSLQSLSRAEYYVYSRCYTRIDRGSANLVSNVRRWMLEASGVPESDLPEPPQDVAPERTLPARVPTPAATKAAQVARVLEQPTQFLGHFAESRPLRTWAAAILREPESGKRMPRYQLVLDYLRASGQLTQDWEMPVRATNSD